MNQSGFAANLVKQFCYDRCDPTPDATPYLSGVPINSIVPSSDVDDSPAQLRRTEAYYQSLIGSIGWLAGATHPDIAPVHSFLLLSSTSQLQVTCMRPSMLSITFTLPMTTGLLSHPQSLHPSIPLFNSRINWTPRRILPKFLHLGKMCPPRLAQRFGDLRLAPQCMTELSFLSSNFVA
jgi:hypothetical protein